MRPSTYHVTLAAAFVLLFATGHFLEAAPPDVVMGLFAGEVKLNRIAPDSPSGTAIFQVDEGATEVYLRITASRAGLTTSIQVPNGQVYIASSIETIGGGYVAFTGSAAADGPILVPLDRPGFHHLYVFPSQGPGNYTIILGLPGVTGDVAVITEFNTDSPIVANIMTTEAAIPPGDIAVLTAAVFQGASPISGATVRAYIQNPFGGQTTLTLRDDGNIVDAEAGDGLYSWFSIPTIVGLHTIVAEITGTSAGGFPFSRTAATELTVVDCEFATPGMLPDCNNNSFWDGCDIAGTTSPDTNGNNVPDECEALPAPAPHNVRKNRYISFAPNFPTDSVAFRITRTSPAFGHVGWVGVPDANGISQVVPDMPAVRPWTEPVIHVGDCEIIPIATYEISPTRNGTVFLTPLLLSTTTVWCDVVGTGTGTGFTPPNGVVNFTDVLAVVLKFLGGATAPPLTWVDVQAVSSDDPCLNHMTNMADIYAVVRAFVGEQYPFTTNPAMCPAICPCPNCSSAPGGGGVPEGFGPQGFGPESGSSIAFDLNVAPYQAQAGQTATVEVYIEGSANLGAFETALALIPATGTIGTLTLESLAIDSARTDYTFNGLSTIGGVNLAEGKAGAVLSSGSGIDITGPDYLSTYTYRASNNAGGVWEVAVSDPSTTATGGAYLLDGEAVNLNAGLGDPKLIRVGVECTLDAHCDDVDACTTDTCTGGVCVHAPMVCNDGNPCTTDACVAGVCQYTPITCNDGNLCTTDACVAGVCQYTPITCNDGNTCTTDACVAGVCQYTPITCNDGNTCTSDACVAGVCVYTNLPNGTICNDGLFCTKTDKCNAVGVCVGGAKTPCTGGQVCCEDWDVCLPPGEPCLPQ